ncbi:MAG: peptidoglycan DD-metalloendopeptidase family protein [Deltaproteobacteria bacterium]|nr:peptidoglycan DD-metalloendopeptidase family protein [Deltaproteobacteria bacterium]
MDRLPLVVGGGALAAYLWTRNRVRTATPAPPMPVTATTSVDPRLPGRWVWPVQSWKGRIPVISDGFKSPRPGLPRHGGVDIMYERLPADTFKQGTPHGAKWHVMPDDVTVVAAHDGVVWSAMPSPTGIAVVIDHSPLKAATFYAHLETLAVKETARAESKQRVRAGELLGTVGLNPLDGERLRHLHFELWLGGPNDRIDPEEIMKRWDVVDDPRRGVLVARNGGFHYRPVGASGEPYPSWVRELVGRAGVYLIRDAETAELLYVGSSTGRLYDTLTRHFQTWRRWKKFWKGQYAEGHDPGLTYKRDSVEVAVRVTRADQALDEEARLIRRLRPRDNLLGQPVDDEVPF